MDVVCEQCRTVYELDEGRVTEAGVTVKCTTCGYLFKVRRRGGAASAAPPAPAPAPPPAAPPPGGGRGWMVRTARGDVYQFGELTVLQQWIVERKVTREDTISRTGDQWKRLGDIVELGAFFQVVDKAVAAEVAARGPAAPAPGYGGQPPGYGGQPPGYGGQPPGYGGTAPGYGGQPAPAAGAPARTTRAPRAASARDVVEPPDERVASGQSLTMPPPLEEEGESMWQVQHRRRVPRWAWGLAAGVALIAALAGAAVKLVPRVLHRGPSEAYRLALQAFRGDTEDGLDSAERALRGLTGGNDRALALALLAEIEAERIQREIERAADIERAGNAQAAESIREAARARAAEAVPRAQAAAGAGPELAETQRALAAAHVVAGSEAATVEEHLTRARAAQPGDIESLYLEGMLRLRDGKSVVAGALLRDATATAEKQTGRPLVRADYRLARLALVLGDQDSARTHLRRVLAVQADHARARKLLAEIDGAAPPPAPAEPPAEAPAPAPAEAPAQEAAEPPAERAPPASAPPAEVARAGGGRDHGGGGSSDDDGRGGGDYDKLVDRGGRYLEDGNARAAASWFERALRANPSGVEALAGMGWVHMDRSRFSSAVNAFRKALDVNSSYSDAIIGLAEAYKAQDSLRDALVYYQRYLDRFPSGPQAGMARRNVQDLEARLPPEPGSAPPRASPRGPAPASAPAAPPPAAPPPALPSSPPAAPAPDEERKL